MSNQLQKLAWMTGLALVLVNPPVLAKDSQKPISKIPQLSEVEKPATSIQQWLAQSLVRITGVKSQATDKGIEVILETNQSDQLQLTNQSQVNSYIVDIPNAQLRLASGDTFRQENPIGGISEVIVTNLDANTIRITVIGESAAPQVQLFDGDEGLIFGVVPTVTTTQTPQTQPTPPQPEQQPSSEIQPEQPSAQNEAPIELVVTGEQDRYRVPNASTGTRTDTLIRDIPQTIQVVPEEVIRDQKVTRLRDALLNVGGVLQDGGFGGTADQIGIRGFFGGGLFGGGILVDGFKDGRSGIRETANLERIEVLKGPASVLYGGVEPGGVINLVTKQPLRDPFFNAELSVGSFSTFRPSIDISGPLNSDKTLLYRLNSVYETSDGFRDFDQDTQRFFISPILKWEINKATNLIFQFDYLNDERPFDRGLLALGEDILDTPLERFFGEPDDVRKVEEIGFSYRLEHNFNDNWKIRNAFRYQSSDTFDYRAEPVRLNETTGILSRNFRANDDYRETYTLQTDLVGKFATGSINHTLLFGIDLARATQGGTQKRLPAGLTPSINVFNPVYNVIPKPGLEELTVVVRDNQDTGDGLGIFLQNQIAMADNLKFLVGGRLDIVDQNSKDLRDGSESNQYDTAIIPRLGIVYQPIEPISLYASYSQSFQPNFATRADGSVLESERGTQYEVGVKGEFLDGRLAGTLAAYHITKSNIATTDLANPDFSVPIGKQRNQGIEFNVAGQILPGWNVIASYSYIDAEITEDNSGLAGNRPANVPFNTASLWTTYELQRGSLQGLGFGLGLFYVGDRLGDADNTYTIPGYLRTDVAIYYQRNNWRAGINIQNLFNEKYFQGSNFGRVAIEPGAPLTVIGSFSMTF
ncbi:TonB-dependent siderophore receptor [Umezakia ovalisporum]|uniref:TonB-dependent siderophore receptor n=2 Tax=Umezakia ovalisporum TaxID=75695 RepID=A0AA43KDU7_9CYAN|nr:TonB-dependent siderophore receptor [Umezakia ovalisporum]MDH6056383.1 TonB-dependent siderophore receptor [Umezakia ovalisporum FSS-43]MDH6062278.1 TonB-dependent siderophore receptor [Umezakia ovalisporum FSS-62]MDH6067765.1 TonB-dependent siderophore receptor [Umezakia ovalisporum APH033B]MDH6070595.1 TonB-dependent siderophore receptor [Umezakia ovalisporum CobakiLakeA]MDH6077063.1 TonB-dependent siderophore receptor [Umezakia ovalisporum FSS-45]